MLKLAATNAPRTTHWDVRRAWEKAYSEVPSELVAADEWRRMLDGVWMPRRLTHLERQWPTTRDAFVLRKLLDGLIVGRVDRNPGELTAVRAV